MDIWIIRLIFGGLILLLIFSQPISQAARGLSNTNWKMPEWNWNLTIAIFAGILVLCLFWATESTLSFLWVILGSNIFWGILLALLIFIAVLTGRWKSLGTILLWIISIIVFILLFGKVRSCVSKSKSAEKSEVHIIVTRQDNGAEVYTGLTPWKGAAYVLVDIRVASNPEQCGRSIRVSCRSWTKDFYLVACGDGTSIFPRRDEGVPVHVSAVQN